MKNKTFHNLTLLMAAAATFQLSGCSLINFGIVAKKNASKPDIIALTTSEINMVKPGDYICVILKSGYFLQGEYNGIICSDSIDINKTNLNESYRFKKIKIKDKDKIIPVNFKDIGQLQIKNEKESLIYAALIGAIVDGLLIYLYNNISIPIRFRPQPQL